MSSLKRKYLNVVATVMLLTNASLVFGQGAVAISSSQRKLEIAPKEYRWRRDYSFSSNNGKPVIVGGRHWDQWHDQYQVKTNFDDFKNKESNSYWIEYIPQNGPSIWIAGGVAYLISSSCEKMDPPAPLPKDSPGIIQGFEIPYDIDGKAYRIWNNDRSRILQEESFREEDWSNLDVRIEPTGDDSLIVHVSHPKAVSIGIQFSLDGETWSDMRRIFNHYPSVDNNRGYKHPADLHLPAWVLKENPHPWIEVDISIGLTIITRRFKYRDGGEPLKGDFAPRTGHEPVWVSAKRANEEQTAELQAKAAAIAQGKAWTAKSVVKQQKLEWSDGL